MALLFSAFALAHGAPQVADRPAGKATVYFYRLKESGPYIKTKTSVYCDDEKLAEIGNERYFAAMLEPGIHTFRSTDKQSGIEKELKAGEVYYVRIEMNLTRIKLFRKPPFRVATVEPEQGKYEVKRLKPISEGDVKNHEKVTLR
jgi:hypothetical protein